MLSHQEIDSNSKNLNSLEWTENFLELHNFALTHLGHVESKALRTLLNSSSAVLDYCATYAELQSISEHPARDALIQIFPRHALGISSPLAEVGIIAIEIFDKIGKIGSEWVSKWEKQGFPAPLMDKIIFKGMQVPNKALHLLLKEYPTEILYAASELLNKTLPTAISKQYNQFIASQYLRDVTHPPETRQLNHVMIDSGLTTQWEKNCLEKKLTSEQTALNSLLAYSQVYQLLQTSASEMHFNEMILDVTANQQEELSSCRKQLHEIVAKKNIYPSLATPNTFFHKAVGTQCVNSLSKEPKTEFPLSTKIILGGGAGGLLGNALYAGMQWNSLQLGLYATSSSFGIAGTLALSEAAFATLSGIGLGVGLIILANSLFNSPKRPPKPIGGAFDFTKGNWDRGTFKHRLNQNGCTTWLNDANDGISGKLGCRSDVSTSTPGYTQDMLFIGNQKHIFSVTGYADKNVDAYLYVRCNKKILVWKTVKLPEGTAKPVQVEFTPEGNGVLCGDVGILINNPKPKKIFRVDKFFVAAVDYPSKTYRGRTVVNVKSPIGGIYDFSTGGDCGFKNNEGVKLSLNTQGQLICESSSAVDNAGMSRLVNLVPGKKHLLEVKGCTQGSGNGRAFLYVKDAEETYSLAALPDQSPGIVQLEFVAPMQDKPISTCEVGVKFSEPSIGKSFVLDHIAVAACGKEPDILQHPVFSYEEPPVEIDEAKRLRL